MTAMIKISFLLTMSIILCNMSQAQQKASDKSFNSVLMEVKHRQAMRNKMIQEMRQTTPGNVSSSSGNNPIETNTMVVSQQTSGAGTNQQPNNPSPSKPANPAGKSKSPKQGKL